MRIPLLILVIVSLVSSQNTWLTWKAETIVTSDQMGSGYFEATVYYDWAGNKQTPIKPAMRIEFKDAGGYVEYYQFNVDRGYNPTVSTGQFTYQYLYKISSNCSCEVASLQVAMPAFFYDSPNQAPSALSSFKYWTVSNTADKTLPSLGVPPTLTKWAPANTNFKTVNTLTGVSKTYNLAQALWLNPSLKKPAGFSLLDPSGQVRTFTITSIIEMTSSALNLVEPTNKCPCGKLVDIALSLDRSGSISAAQWQLEHDFIKAVANSFEYGPLGANLGIGNWNAQHWTNLPLPSGNSLATVNQAVNAMTCCTGSNQGECCCCGTPIGGGIYLGYNMLLQGRPKATKVLIVLTDGCQNHLWTGSSAVKCQCSDEKACANNLTCTGDITKWYNAAKQAVPGTTIIAVGVGTPDTICPEQLKLATGGDTNNVYQPQSWTELQTIVKTISSTACSQTAVPCTGCCGLCACGKCYPVPKCRDTDQCNKGVFDKTTQCCRTDPVECKPPPCFSASCDKSMGCVYKNITCKNSTNPCTEWACNSTTIVCLQRPAANAPPSCSGIKVDECVNHTDCIKGDTHCTIYNCTLGKCVSVARDCGLSDNCTTRFCKALVGCTNVTRTCNDRNACTIDKCIPSIGCEYTPKGPCPQPKEQCFKAICDPIKDCINVPVNCSEYGYFASVKNCTVPACNVTCYNQFLCVAPAPISSETNPQTVILASALGTAAVVGIVIGAAILLAGLGTAAGVAIVGAAGAGGVALVAHNPTYVAAGNAGNNVLYKNDS